MSSENGTTKAFFQAGLTKNIQGKRASWFRFQVCIKQPFIFEHLTQRESAQRWLWHCNECRVVGCFRRKTMNNSSLVTALTRRRTRPIIIIRRPAALPQLNTLSAFTILHCTVLYQRCCMYFRKICKGTVHEQRNFT